MGSTVCSECTQGNPADVSCCIKVVILWLRCAHEFHWHLWMLTIIFQLGQRIRAVPWWLPPTGMSQWWMWGRNCHANYRCQIDLTMNRWKCDGCTLNHVLLACQLILFSTVAIEGNITNVRPDPVHYMLTNVRAKDVRMLLLFCEFFWKEGKELKLYWTLYFVTIFFWLKNLLFFLSPYPSLVADDTMVEWWLSFLFFSPFLSNCFDFTVACLWEITPVHSTVRLQWDWVDWAWQTQVPLGHPLIIHTTNSSK